MSLKDSVVKTARFAVNYAKGLVAEIPEARMCEQPAGVVNHPAWILGHLAVTNLGLGPAIIGAQMPPVPDGWNELFGIRSQPTTDRTKYPSKAQLLETLESSTNVLIEAFERADDKLLAEPNPIEGLAKAFPTKGDVTTFGLATHPTMHLGQLSAWRRAAGLKSVF